MHRRKFVTSSVAQCSSSSGGCAKAMILSSHGAAGESTVSTCVWDPAQSPNALRQTQRATYPSKTRCREPSSESRLRKAYRRRSGAVDPRVPRGIKNHVARYRGTSRATKGMIVRCVRHRNLVGLRHETETELAGSSSKRDAAMPRRPKAESGVAGDGAMHGAVPPGTVSSSQRVEHPCRRAVTLRSTITKTSRTSTKPLSESRRLFVEHPRERSPGTARNTPKNDLDPRAGRRDISLLRSANNPTKPTTRSLAHPKRRPCQEEQHSPTNQRRERTIAITGRSNKYEKDARRLARRKTKPRLRTHTWSTARCTLMS